jgi:hypothetical protein
MKLRVYIRQCDVMLIFVDECEHISNHKFRRRLLEISNFSPHVPIICASCEPHKWVSGDVEIAERWNDYFRLEPYVGERLCQLLSFLGLLLPFSEDSYLEQRTLSGIKEGVRTKGSSTSTPTVGPAAVIERCTKGILKDIMILLVSASQRAIQANKPCLNVELLQKTWEDIRERDVESAIAALHRKG